MKKAVNILSLISVIAVILCCVTLPFMFRADQRNAFIATWFLGILAFLALPLFFRAFSLAYNRNKISPKIWLSIYSVMAIIYIVVIISFGFIGYTRDLPLAFRREYSSVSGEVHTVRFVNSTQRINIANLEFRLELSDFEPVNRNNTYQVIYLPNSRRVIDVIDENGRSLLR